MPVLFIAGLYGVKSYLVDWLKQNGAETASIEKLSLNPFIGRLTLNGLDVQVEGNSLLKNAEMVVNVGFTSLLSKNIEVQSALYSGFVLDLEQFEDGSLRIGSYTIEKSGEEKAAEVTEEKVSSWAFLADNVDLKNCLVKVKTPDLDLQLMVEKAELRQFTTREGQASATFLLIGQLDEQPIRIELSELQVIPSLQLKGDVEVTQFPLSEIASFLKDTLPVFAGDIGLDGAVEFSTGGSEGMVVDYTGLIKAVQPDIGSGDFATRAEELSWQGAVHFSSADGKPMSVVTDGVLAAANYALEVPGADFSTSESLIELQGKNTVTIAENVLVENDGRLFIEKSEILVPGSEIRPDEFLWQGTVTYDSNHSGEGQYVAAKGELQLGPLAFISGEADSKNIIQSQDLGWTGDITYGLGSERKGSYVQLAGELSGSDVGADLSSAMKIAQQTVQLTTDSTINFGDSFDIKGTNSVVLGSFSFDGGTDGPKVALEKLQIQDLEGLGNQNLRLKQLTSEGLAITLAGNLPLDITVPAIELNGFATEDLASFNVESIGLEKPKIVASHNGEDFLQLDEIKASELLIDESQQVSAGSFNLVNLIFLGGEKAANIEPFLSLGEAKLSGIKWAGVDGFTGETLHFNDLVTTVIKDKEGELNISKRLAAMQVPGGEGVAQEEVEEAAEEGDEAMPIRLGEIAVTGESHVNFEDHTLAVPYITDLAITKMELSDLDSTRPETKSPFVLNAKLEERAPFDVTGDISPFMAPIALKLKLKLKNYPLSRLSAYTVQSVGTALASGQLKLKTKIDLENDNLDMDNEIILKKLETETISPELAQELNNQLPIPLDAALSILRDSDRNITLDIPLSGPVSDLSVGISDVLITALSKAIVPAASGYLMYTLGPYGALAYVGMKVGEKMLKVELPPVEFTPGETTITDEHKKYLEKVAEILKGRPETDVTLCPQVTSWEFMDEKAISEVEGKSIEVSEDDKEKLIELGQKRAKVVQDYMATTYELETSRLLICDTLIVNEKSDKPLLMLNL
ncbi:hypothetical protein LA52FAK_03640 [Desulforhopalus sp. 52FAK]